MFSFFRCVFAWGELLDSRPEPAPRHPGTSLEVCSPPPPAFTVLRSEIHSHLAHRYDEPEGQEDEEFLPNAEGKKPVRFTDVGAGMDGGKPGFMPDQNQTHFMFSVRRKDFVRHVCLQSGQRNHGQRHPWISLCNGQHWHHLLLVSKYNTPTCKLWENTLQMLLPSVFVCYRWPDCPPLSPYRFLLTAVALLSCYSIHLLVKSAGIVGKFSAIFLSFK